MSDCRNYDIYTNYLSQPSLTKSRVILFPICSVQNFDLNLKTVVKYLWVESAGCSGLWKSVKMQIVSCVCVRALCVCVSCVLSRYIMIRKYR